ncbi:MAG TPA: DNA polymerase III subunit delta [Acidobacteriota bacterium]|nr:DNA polymerase III subunit delta [Acidobacteriota bacterium]
MKYSDFLKAVQTRTLQPVVTFLGDETFLKERALEAVLKRFLDEESRHYNYRCLVGEEIKDTSFLEEASTLPMFSDLKVIYIKNAEILDKNLSRFKEYMERYLQNPAPETLLIFDVDKWEGRSKLKAMLAARSAVVEFNPLSERELPAWITGHLRTLNFQIDSQAIQALIERTGVDLQKIASELEKLMLLRHTEKRITADDVEKTVGHSPVATVWQWTDAILEEKAEKAIDLLNDLLLLGEEPVKCVGILAKQYEKMILTKEMVIQKVPEATIAQKIGKPVYYLRPYLSQIARYNMDDLVKALRILSATDRALKSTQANDETILHLMTLQLCRLKTAAPPVFDVPLQ